MRRRHQVSISEVICDLLYILLFVMTTIYTLYRPNGYVELGEEKFKLFRLICLAIFLISGASLAVLLSRKNERKKLQNDIAGILRGHGAYGIWDVFCIAAVASHLLSFFLAYDRTTALWGITGWRTGLLPFLAMFLLFASFARYFRLRTGFYGILLLAPTLVGLLGILNRFDVYVDLLIFQTDSYYLSTIGNINWFAGFLSVFLPVAPAVFMNAKDRKELCLSCACSAVFLVAALLQGSDSIVPAISGMYAVLLFAGCADRARWQRFLLLVSLQGLCMEICACLIRYSGKYNFYIEESIAARLCVRHTGVILLALAAGLLFVSKKRADRVFPGKRICRAVGMITIAVLLAGCIAGLILWYSIDHPDRVYTWFRSDALVLTNDWGSTRGGTYRLSFMLFRSLPFSGKLFGIGQDCIYAYTTQVPELMAFAKETFGSRILTNAHSIPLTTMINRGWVGLIADTGFYVTGCICCADTYRKHPDDTCSLMALAATVSCLINGLVSFEQLLSTPFLFVLLGVARSMHIADGVKETNPQTK